MIWPFNTPKEKKEVVAPSNVVPFVPKVVKEPEPPQTHYTVGNDSEGRTVLKIGGDGYYTTTLTMNAAGTRHLIKLLTATIQD